METRCRPIEFKANGLTLRGKAWGDPSQFPVLALHGWLDNCSSFDVLAPGLRNIYLVALDMAGHGLSDDRSQDADYNIWKDIGELLEIADRSGWQHFGLLGHSRGGIIVTLLAGAFPHRAKAVGLVDGIIPVPVDPLDAPNQLARAIFDNRKNWQRPPRYFADRAKALEARTRARQPMALESAMLIAGRSLMKSEDGWYWRADSRLRGASEFKLSLSHITGFLRQITCPVQLTVSPRGIHVREPDLFGKVTEALPQLELIELPGNHHLHMEQQAAAIAENLNRLYAGVST